MSIRERHFTKDFQRLRFVLVQVCTSDRENKPKRSKNLCQIVSSNRLSTPNLYHASVLLKRRLSNLLQWSYDSWEDCTVLPAWPSLWLPTQTGSLQAGLHGWPTFWSCRGTLKTEWVLFLATEDPRTFKFWLSGALFHVELGSDHQNWMAVLKRDL